ncbi:MAG TPA: hypothetical protein GXZ56_01820 [Bacteroidales bacterium]|nr:hypothetical protein [Bacteroidales bacterium]
MAFLLWRSCHGVSPHATVSPRPSSPSVSRLHHGQSRERDGNSLCPGEVTAMVQPSFRERDGNSLCPRATLSGGVILRERGRGNGISNGNSKRPGL